ncbi:hypothetical protein SCHPADRAFT_902052 [Schizopora paradoxa]|uniref:Uncharacterized protein n=1 Tax=Schizopora paradoxa TaxID=27342 RepID=A0A0H2S208_9AGAM|nr:hypothetical protein SCHPADRAFT_902052 [Schizopora paradoxa]
MESTPEGLLAFYLFVSGIATYLFFRFKSWRIFFRHVEYRSVRQFDNSSADARFYNPNLEDDPPTGVSI